MLQTHTLPGINWHHVPCLRQPSGKNGFGMCWSSKNKLSNHDQSCVLHVDMTSPARMPHVVAASSRIPAIEKQSHWSGPCERGGAGQCVMKCSGLCEALRIRLRTERLALTKVRCESVVAYPISTTVSTAQGTTAQCKRTTHHVRT